MSIVSLIANIFYIQTIFARSMAKIFKGFVIALICCVLFSNKAVAQNHSDETKQRFKYLTQKGKRFRMRSLSRLYKNYYQTQPILEGFCFLANFTITQLRIG